MKARRLLFYSPADDRLKLANNVPKSARRDLTLSVRIDRIRTRKYTEQSEEILSGDRRAISRAIFFFFTR